jgi:3-methylfumaryl-CoA hydratase
MRASGLAQSVAGWAPEPTETSDRVTSWAVSAFSAMLDLPEPAAGEGDPVPPLWHWFAFLDHPRHGELGDDGHPAAGQFLPPIPHRRRMIAGGRLAVHAPLLVGETVRRRSSLARVELKRGRSGEMAFVTVRHEFRRGEDLLLVEEQDTVYRSQAPGQARYGGGGAAPGTTDPHRWTIDVEPDAALLFRFSALTHNAHRIHYDEPYATRVEAYPGLVVHGPLLALLLLEVPRRHLPGRAVTSFDYRLTRPVFVGDRVVAGGVPDGADALSLACGVPGAAASIRATASLA